MRNYEKQKTRERKLRERNSKNKYKKITKKLNMHGGILGLKTLRTWYKKKRGTIGSYSIMNTQKKKTQHTTNTYYVTTNKLINTQKQMNNINSNKYIIISEIKDTLEKLITLIKPNNGNNGNDIDIITNFKTLYNICEQLFLNIKKLTGEYIDNSNIFEDLLLFKNTIHKQLQGYNNNMKKMESNKIKYNDIISENNNDDSYEKINSNISLLTNIKKQTWEYKPDEIKVPDIDNINLYNIIKEYIDILNKYIDSKDKVLYDHYIKKPIINTSTTKNTNSNHINTHNTKKNNAPTINKKVSKIEDIKELINKFYRLETNNLIINIILKYINKHETMLEQLKENIMNYNGERNTFLQIIDDKISEYTISKNIIIEKKKEEINKIESDAVNIYNSNNNDSNVIDLNDTIGELLSNNEIIELDIDKDFIEFKLSELETIKVGNNIFMINDKHKNTFKEYIFMSFYKNKDRKELVILIIKEKHKLNEGSFGVVYKCVTDIIIYKLNDNKITINTNTNNKLKDILDYIMIKDKIIDNIDYNLLYNNADLKYKKKNIVLKVNTKTVNISNEYKSKNIISKIKNCNGVIDILPVNESYTIMEVASDDLLNLSEVLYTLDLDDKMFYYLDYKINFLLAYKIIKICINQIYCLFKKIKCHYYDIKIENILFKFYKDNKNNSNNYKLSIHLADIGSINPINILASKYGIQTNTVYTTTYKLPSMNSNNHKINMCIPIRDDILTYYLSYIAIMLLYSFYVGNITTTSNKNQRMVYFNKQINNKLIDVLKNERNHITEIKTDSTYIMYTKIIEILESQLEEMAKVHDYRTQFKDPYFTEKFKSFHRLFNDIDKVINNN